MVRSAGFALYPWSEIGCSATQPAWEIQMPKPFDATMKDLGDQSPEAFVGEFDGPPQLPVVPLNVDLSTVTTAADLVFGLGEPLQEVIHIDCQAHQGRPARRFARLQQLAVSPLAGAGAFDCTIAAARSAPWQADGHPAVCGATGARRHDVHLRGDQALGAARRALPEWPAGNRAVGRAGAVAGRHSPGTGLGGRNSTPVRACSRRRRPRSLVYY